MEARDAAEDDEDEEQAGGVERPISWPSYSREPTPYLPIVNAIAPKAPIGATFMM